MSFIHEHCHSVFSFLDGAASLKGMATRAKELGMKAIALTDHNSLGGIPKFVEACKGEGIKPLLGVEGYYTLDASILSLPVEERNALAEHAALEAGAVTEDEIEYISKNNKKAVKAEKDRIKSIIKQYAYNTKQYHILFLAMNQNGWNNLVKLQSEAAEKCTFNGRFLCDDKLLEKYNEDIIMTSACIGSYPAEMINHGDYTAAEDCVKNWHRIFGDRFYLEIQPLNIDKQWNVNLTYMNWSEKYGIELTATNDTHYVLKEDHDDHDTLLCVGTGAFKSQTERMRYSNDFWIRSEEEMEHYFTIQANAMVENGMIESSFVYNEIDIDCYLSAARKAMDNTCVIADRCDSDSIKLGSDKPLFPRVKIPHGFTPEEWLTMKAWMNLYKYLNKHPEYDRRTYEKQLRYELEIINQKGFAPYFLTVEEYAQHSESVDNPVGPGRGSAAGSLALYMLGITKNIDPIQYDLMFERFLTPDRTECPDVDLDFSNQLVVINHMEEVYGKPCVAHVGTYGAMGVKSGLKDFARVLNIPFEDANAISKTIDKISDKPSLKFKDLDALKDTDIKLWTSFNELEEKNKEVFRLARRFEGTPRQFGIHASGILITPGPVTSYFPTRKDPKTHVTVTLWDKDEIEEMNGVKFDILGLNTLTVLRDTLRIIDENLTMQDLYDTVDVNDPEIFRIINEKNTGGLFQIESGLFKGIIDSIKPNCLDDIIAITSIARPGPLSAGMHTDYAKRKNCEEEISYPIRGCEDILKGTYGVIAYQEELMAISRRIAGFDAGQADSLTRKVTAKKKQSMMSMLRRCHFYGKKNCKGPEGWEEDEAAPWYDEDAHYGGEIPGGVNMGYTVDELNNYWGYILGFCSYAFNKSHAACYSYLTILTSYLKVYYPQEFMTALLSHPTKDEDIPKYAENAEQMGIKVRVPDINRSGKKFTLDKDANEILFGFESVKGVGESSIDSIIAERPYSNLQDTLTRLPKKVFNKRVGIALIKAGAFDWENDNRYDMINSFYDIRKDKDDRLNPEVYDEDAIIAIEQEILGIPITFKPWWYKLKNETYFEENAELLDVVENIDRNGNMMAFIKTEINKCLLDCTVFSSVYCKNVGAFDVGHVKTIRVKGKKDKNGKCVINKVLRIVQYHSKSIIMDSTEEDMLAEAVPF